MKRKVAQIGPSTLMISLPTEWVKAHKLQKGDELDVFPGRNEITFSQGERKAKTKEITLDITPFNKYLLSRYLEVLYFSNYSKIILTHKKNTMYDQKHQEEISVRALLKKLSNRYIGMEIVSQTRNMTEIRCFLLDKEKDLRTIEKRIYFLFKGIMEEFLQSLDHNHKEFYQNIYEHHDTITKFVTYYLRVLDQSEKTEEEKKQLYSLYLTIDKMMDKFRHLNQSIDQYGCTPTTKNMLKDIFELVYEFFTAYHKGRITAELVAKRYALMRKSISSDYSPEELRVVNEIRIFLDSINDFTRAVILEELVNNDSQRIPPVFK
ncbi:hypothetical protein COV20_06260 [Candidatus Woesearchaeota archaeon CG10_big_fil_rev_8_21_14_0_10_45_16]|nr:MAG: hypothetical protein COV20_06260 [Candidatus Woesearchaeota archaeon CG10_big_fil_rev_8_21_14_0_10_45_16]